MMTFRFKIASLAAFTLMLFPAIVFAGEADVVGASFVESSDGVFRFDVTIAHADTGWEHYANAFEIVGPNGEVLGTRVLVHPHVDEQPFTRSLNNVEIPDGITSIIVRAVDSVHERGGLEMVLQIRTSPPA